jgi:hypothetical protein
MISPTPQQQTKLDKEKKTVNLQELRYSLEALGLGYLEKRQKVGGRTC